MRRIYSMLALFTALLQLPALSQAQQPESVGAAPSTSAAQSAPAKKTTLEAADGARRIGVEG
jgi:hypothetical protein